MSGLFQNLATKSIWMAIAGFGVLFLVGWAVAGTPCEKALGLTETTVRPVTTWESCAVYGTFWGMQANEAPFILGALAALLAWPAEMFYENAKEIRENERQRREMERRRPGA
jgi:hypothetical protein